MPISKHINSYSCEKTWKKINQQACYNRIWSWSPMPCEKHGPWASVTTKPRPSASVFVYWVPRATFFTRHGRPWSNPTTYYFAIVFKTFITLRWQKWRNWRNIGHGLAENTTCTTNDHIQSAHITAVQQLISFEITSLLMTFLNAIFFSKFQFHFGNLVI